MHSAGKMSDEELHELECVACPVRRLLRRPVHRQHHGLRVRGDRPGAARLGRCARAVREPRRLRARERQGGHAAARATASVRATSARAKPSRTPRSSSRRPAARPTARCICPPWRTKCGIDFDLFDGRRDLQAHALHRRPEAGRQIRRQGRLRHRRRAADPAGAARRRRAARRLHDRHRQDAWRRTSRSVEVQRRPEGRLSGFQSALADGRRRRPQGLARARRRHRQGRRHRRS